MGIALKKLFCELLFLAFQFLDKLTLLFRVLCGIETFADKGEETTLIDLFLGSEPIVLAFLSILLISGIVIMISTMVAFIRRIVNESDKRPHSKIAFQSIFAIISSLVMASVMIAGVFFSNTVLKLVDEATSPDDANTTLSQQIFDMSLKEKTVRYEYVYKQDENGDKVFDEDGNPIVVGVNVIEEDSSYWTYKKDGETLRYTAEDIDFSEKSVDDVFGVRHKKLGLFENEDSGYQDKKQPMVELKDFNIVMAYLTTIMILVALIGSMLGLVKRVYDLVMLFLILPLVSGVMPLDDGARLKQWQNTVVSKVILGYGAVLSVNIYLLILPQIKNLTLFDGVLANNLFKIFLIIGGALCVSGGQLLMARVFGTSAEESREMAQSARALAAGAATAIHAPGRIVNATMGQRMSDGQGGYFRAGGLLGRGGLIRGTGRAIGGATNFVGNVLGGEAYRRPAGSVASAASRAGGAVKQAFLGATSLRRGPSATAAAPSQGGGVTPQASGAPQSDGAYRGNPATNRSESPMQTSGGSVGSALAAAQAQTPIPAQNVQDGTTPKDGAYRASPAPQSAAASTNTQSGNVSAENKPVSGATSVSKQRNASPSRSSSGNAQSGTYSSSPAPQPMAAPVAATVQNSTGGIAANKPATAPVQPIGPDVALGAAQRGAVAATSQQSAANDGAYRAPVVGPSPAGTTNPVGAVNEPAKPASTYSSVGSSIAQNEVASGNDDVSYRDSGSTDVERQAPNMRAASVPSNTPAQPEQPQQQAQSSQTAPVSDIALQAANGASVSEAPLQEEIMPEKEHKGLFRNGLIGAMFELPRRIAGANKKWSDSSNSAYPEMDTKPNDNSVYVKPQANFTPKAQAESKTVVQKVADGNTQINNAKSNSSNNGVANGALQAAKNAKAGKDEANGKFRRKKK